MVYGHKNKSGKKNPSWTISTLSTTPIGQGESEVWCPQWAEDVQDHGWDWATVVWTITWHWSLALTSPSHCHHCLLWASAAALLAVAATSKTSHKLTKLGGKLLSNKGGPSFLFLLDLCFALMVVQPTLALFTFTFHTFPQIDNNHVTYNHHLGIHWSCALTGFCSSYFNCTRIISLKRCVDTS